MEIRTEPIQDNQELSKELKDKLANEIQANYAKWDDERISQIDTAKRIMEETYLNQPAKKYEKGLEWESDVKTNELYNIKRAKKSVLWREMWSEPSQMFEVQGTNEQTNNVAKEQKANIVDALNKMNVGKQFDAGIDNLFDIGEIIFKTDWIAKKKVVKRQKKNIGFQLMNVISQLSGAGYTTVPMKDVEIPIYENARVESISPFMFVFDTSKFKPRDKDNWDSIIKIYKRFDTLDNIKNNKIYNITPDIIADLEEKDQKSEDTKELVELRDEDVYSGQYSILYAHGDFKIKGKLYKNYIAEVLAGKYLIRFEENPLSVNPFILCALEYDNKTKRGISPLKSCLSMVKKQEDLINNAFDIQELQKNPPSYANEKFYNEKNTDKDGRIKLAPGLVIMVANDYSGQLPTPLSIQAGGIDSLIQLLDTKVSEISSVSNVSYGNIEESKRTATELQLASQGSSAQASKELDTIYQDLTIPMIENVAELLATFKDGVDYVYLQEKGKNIEYKITNEIRQAQYNYIYEDRNALNDRKGKFDQLYQLFNGLAQVPELQGKLNWNEIATQGIELIGFDNSSKFFNDMSPVQQFAKQFEQLPQEVQQELMPQFAQATQQTIQQYQQMMQQNQMQEQANNQVQMDMYRQQARANAEQELFNQQGAQNGIV